MGEVWLKQLCPTCKAINWFCLGDLSDMTVEDLEAGECLSCKRQWIFVDEDGIDGFPNTEVGSGDPNEHASTYTEWKGKSFNQEENEDQDG